MPIYMQESELKKRWKLRSMSDKGMVQCLADLNGCSFIEMRNELMRLNIISEKDKNILNKKATKWSNSEIQEMVRLAELGYESEKIAEIITKED